MTRLIFVLALIGATGVAHAQVVVPTDPPKGPVHIDQEGYARDATGAIIDRKANRIIGSNTARPGPGDYGMPPAPHETRDSYAPSMAAQPMASPSPGGSAIVDEYGRHYDSRGNRIR